MGADDTYYEYNAFGLKCREYDKLLSLDKYLFWDGDEYSGEKDFGIDSDVGIWTKLFHNLGR